MGQASGQPGGSRVAQRRVQEGQAHLGTGKAAFRDPGDGQALVGAPGQAEQGDGVPGQHLAAGSYPLSEGARGGPWRRCLAFPACGSAGVSSLLGQTLPLPVGWPQPQPTASACGLWPLARRPGVSKLSKETSWNCGALGSPVAGCPEAGSWAKADCGPAGSGSRPAPPMVPQCPPPSLRPLSQSRGMEGGSCPGCRAQRGWQRGGSHPWHQPQLPQAWDTPPVLRAPVRPLGVRGCSTLLSPCFTGHTLESAAPRLTLGPGLCRERTLPLLHLGPLQRGLHAGAHSALPAPIPRLRCGSGDKVVTFKLFLKVSSFSYISQVATREWIWGCLQVVQGR